MVGMTTLPPPAAANFCPTPPSVRRLHSNSQVVHATSTPRHGRPRSPSTSTACLPHRPAFFGMACLRSCRPRGDRLSAGRVRSQSAYRRVLTGMYMHIYSVWAKNRVLWVHIILTRRPLGCPRTYQTFCGRYFIPLRQVRRVVGRFRRVVVKMAVLGWMDGIYGRDRWTGWTG